MKPAPTKPGKKLGPKPMINRKLLRQVERLAAKGLNQKQIALVLNINACTISNWKHGDEPLDVKFREALERGQAQGIKARLDKIDKASKKSWQAAAWALERLQPEQFGRVQHTRLGNPDGTPIQQAPTVIAPTVVFVQPDKLPLPAAIDVPEVKPITNGHGLPSGNGKH